MKELIIGLNERTKELANLIRKDNESTRYIYFGRFDSCRFKFTDDDLCSVAFIVVDYNNVEEVRLASVLVKCLVNMYSMYVITIACNTAVIYDDLYHSSTAITYIGKVDTIYDESVVNVINSIDTIICNKNNIKIDRSYLFDFNRKKQAFNVPLNDGIVNFINDEEDSKYFIVYVEGNNKF